MTFPDDFAAEWRAEERERRFRRLGDAMAAIELASIMVGTASFEATAAYRRLRIAAQAQRLSAWGPWR